MKNRKIKTLLEILKIVQHSKRIGLKIVTTNGCFDLLHVGHVRNLKMAKTHGDLLIVGINSDASVRMNKDSTRPIIHEKERAELIAALEFVDYVFIFKTKTPIPWLTKVKPAIHVKGSDRTLHQIPERLIVEKHGGIIVLVPHTKKHSTSAIVKKIQSL